MADSQAVTELCGNVEGLSLASAGQTYPNAHPHTNPLDVWRMHISNVLSKITGVETGIIFPLLSWTSSLDKGDFSLPVPALRIKGQKPDALAKEWSDKVRTP